MEERGAWRGVTLTVEGGFKEGFGSCILAFLLAPQKDSRFPPPGVLHSTISRVSLSHSSCPRVAVYGGEMSDFSCSLSHSSCTRAAVSRGEVMWSFSLYHSDCTTAHQFLRLFLSWDWRGRCGSRVRDTGRRVWSR